MTMSTQRRGGLGRRLAAALAATAMTILAVAGTAGAAAPDQTPEQAPPTLPEPALPPVGATFDLAVTTEGIEATFNGQTITTGPLKGSVTFTIEANPADPLAASVVAKPTEFTLSAQTEQGFGPVTIEQSDTGATPDSPLELVSQSPPTFRQTMFLDFTMTIENPPQGPGAEQTEQSEPLVLTTKNPGQLVGSLSSFPPKGDIYRLQNPIDLVVADNPDQVIATIDKFPVKVGSL